MVAHFYLPYFKNATMRNSTIFYRSFYESIQELPLETQARIYNAIFDYSLNSRESDLKGIDLAIFTLIKPQLDANNKRYENGLKPKISKTEANKKQNRSKTEANKNDNVNDNVNKNNNVNVNKNKNKEGDFIPITPLEKKYAEFVEFRKQKKVPIVKASIDAFKKKLWKLSNQNEETAIEILNQSIENGWTGIFELKNYTKNGNEKTRINNDFEKAIQDEYIAAKLKRHSITQE